MEQTDDGSDPRRAWRELAFAPAAILILLLLPVLAPLSIPYYRVFPDHHAHMFDFEGTPRERHRLAQWRAAYKRLGLCGRIRRAREVSRRRTVSKPKLRRPRLRG